MKAFEKISAGEYTTGQVRKTHSAVSDEVCYLVVFTCKVPKCPGRYWSSYISINKSVFEQCCMTVHEDKIQEISDKLFDEDGCDDFKKADREAIISAAEPYIHIFMDEWNNNPYMNGSEQDAFATKFMRNKDVEKMNIFGDGLWERVK